MAAFQKYISLFLFEPLQDINGPMVLHGPTPTGIQESPMIKQELTTVWSTIRALASGMIIVAMWQNLLFVNYS